MEAVINKQQECSSSLVTKPVKHSRIRQICLEPQRAAQLEADLKLAFLQEDMYNPNF